MRILQGDMLLQ